MSVLMTHHNLAYYQNLMARVRAAIASGSFAELKAETLATFGAYDIYNIPEAG